MKKSYFRFLLFMILAVLMSVALTACGSDDTENQNINTTEYESENLGFSISMDEELFAVITFDAYKEGYDANFDSHKWKNTISAEIEGVSVPLFYVNVYDGEFDEKTVAEKTPDAAYLGVANGYTYTMTFSVDGDGAELKDKAAYEDMMEKYVYPLADYAVIYGSGEALYHEGENTEARLAWLKGVDKQNFELAMDPVVMVLPEDKETISAMEAAGVTADFSQGYMIWNEKEEDASVTFAEDAKFFLLDESFNFVEVSADDLAGRLQNGDLLISYITDGGRIIEVYEQYLMTDSAAAAE